MAKVKGSKQDKLVVRRHRPVAAVAAKFLFLAIAVLMAFGSFYLGRYYEVKMQVVEPSERAQLEMLRQEISALQRDRLVDQLALETSQKAIKELEEELYQQGKIVSFYKSVMDPQHDAKGLHVQRFYVSAAQEPGQYDVSWVMTQVGKNDTEIAGRTNLRILGVIADEPAVLEMADISSQDESLAFQFRYFQTLTLRVTLPEGFTAEKIEIVAQSKEKKPQSVTRKFDWLVQEALVDAR